MSHFVASGTPAQKPLSIRLQLQDGRHARTWSEPLQLTISIANTGKRVLELPWGATFGKDLQLSTMRQGGIFLRTLRLQSTAQQLLELAAPRSHIAPGAALTRSTTEKPLIQVPPLGLFWAWVELRARPLGKPTQGIVPSGAFRSNPIPIWWRGRAIRLSKELEQIGASIRRHQAGPRSGPRQRPAASKEKERPLGAPARVLKPVR